MIDHETKIISMTFRQSTNAERAGLLEYQSAREETMSMTEEIVRVEGEIDERVKGLYGV